MPNPLSCKEFQRAHKKKLYRIFLYAVFHLTRDFGPRAIWALSAAFVTCLIVGVVDGFGTLFVSSPWLAFAAFYFFGRAPLTWSEILDAELARFDPLDIDAFRDLQANTASSGFIEREAFNRWLAFERRALELVEGVANNSPRQLFLNRKF